MTSALRNHSLHIISQSKVKTITSFDQNHSFIRHDENHNIDGEEEFSQQFQKNCIMKWYRKKNLIAFTHSKEEDNSKSSSFYLLRVDEVCDIPYKKSNNSHKLYLKVCANLLDKENDSYRCRTIHFNASQLESQTATHSHYKLLDPFNIYFHTKYNANLTIIIDFHVCESIEIDKQEIVQFQTYLGYIEVDPFKSSRSKQKLNLFSKKTQLQIQSAMIFNIIMTDSLNILEKLIPANCLCNSEDIIGGLSSKSLPNYQINLMPQLQYTQLYSFRCDFSGIDISDYTLQETLKTAEVMYRSFSNAEHITCSFKQMRMHAYFHNGWTFVNESSVIMKDKLQIQKKSSKIIKYIHYNCEEICMLPFVFMQQQSIFVFQVVGRIEVKTKRGKQPEQTHYVELPVCFTFYAVDKQLSQHKNVRRLKNGNAFTGGLHNILEENDVGVLETRKSIPENQMQGKIEFYTELNAVNKMHFSKHNLTTNKSVVEIDKVHMHKQRMMRENKKIKLENRKKKIQLNQQIPILDTTQFKKSLYMDQVQKVREQRKEKEELLKFLKSKLNELDDVAYQEELENFQNINFNYANQKQSIETQHFHHTSLVEGNNHNVKIVENNSAFNNSSRFRQEVYYDLIYVPKLYQENQINNEEVPMQIIKTQLLQQNYSYGILINFLALQPLTQHILIPRKFFITFKFFNSQPIETPHFSIHQSTGEIEQENNEGINKIIFIQFPPLPEIQNNSHKFIEFIGYLHHSELQIKIIDFYSKIQFGECYFRLKDLVRMRRNDVSVMRDLIVRKEQSLKGKLKLQIKSIRKEYEPKQKPIVSVSITTSKIEELSLPAEIRQQKRIEKYKMMKNQGRTQEAKSQKIEKILNENLVLDEIKVNVNRMKGQFIWVQIKNTKPHIEEYFLSINDPDKQYIKDDELVIVDQQIWKNVSRSRWWKYLQAIGADKNKLSSHKLPQQDGSLEVQSSQTVNILFYYYTQRKYEGDYHQNEEKESQLLRLFNHSRCIDITVTNKGSKSLLGIYKLYIIPQPDFNTLHYNYTRKLDEKIQVSLPYFSEHNLILYIDDPKVVATHYQERKQVILDCFPGSIQHPKQLQVSLLSPAPEHRILYNYYFTFYGAEEIYIEGQLWEMTDILLDFHSSMSKKISSNYLIALSEDERIIQIRDKNPIKINTKQSKTMIRVRVTPKEYGIRYYEVNLIHPESYAILYRYIIKCNIPKPVINEKMTLKLRLTDKILEELFNFTNQQARKIKYTIFSTKQHILWCPSDTFEVDAKGEKKIKIKINAQIVTNNEIVVLCLKSQKISHFYQFNLELSDIL